MTHQVCGWWPTNTTGQLRGSQALPFPLKSVGMAGQVLGQTWGECMLQVLCHAVPVIVLRAHMWHALACQQELQTHCTTEEHRHAGPARCRSDGSQHQSSCHSQVLNFWSHHEAGEAGAQAALGWAQESLHNAACADGCQSLWRMGRCQTLLPWPRGVSGWRLACMSGKVAASCEPENASYARKVLLAVQPADMCSVFRHRQTLTLEASVAKQETAGATDRASMT